MTRQLQKLYFVGGLLIALIGVLLLIGSFAVLLHNTGRDGAFDSAPLLFIAALVAVRVGVLMCERHLCSDCGRRIERAWKLCPGCDEPIGD